MDQADFDRRLGTLIRMVSERIPIGHVHAEFSKGQVSFTFLCRIQGKPYGAQRVIPRRKIEERSIGIEILACDVLSDWRRCVEAAHRKEQGEIWQGEI